MEQEIIDLSKEPKEENLNILKQTLAHYESLEIKTYDDNVHVVTVLQEIKHRKNNLEQTRKSLTKPLKDYCKKIESKFKVYIDKLKHTDEILRGKVAVYEDKVKKENEAQAEKLNKQTQEGYAERVKEAVEKGNNPPPPPNPIEIKKQEVEGLQIRKVWKYRIKNFKEIDRDLLMVDDKKVKDKIKEGVRQLNGLEIYQETITAIES